MSRIISSPGLSGISLVENDAPGTSSPPGGYCLEIKRDCCWPQSIHRQGCGPQHISSMSFTGVVLFPLNNAVACEPSLTAARCLVSRGQAFCAGHRSMGGVLHRVCVGGIAALLFKCRVHILPAH
ncbi:unnamed protein product [Lota lota]